MLIPRGTSSIKIGSLSRSAYIQRYSFDLLLIVILRLKYIFDSNFRQVLSNQSQFYFCAQIDSNFRQFCSIKFLLLKSFKSLTIMNRIVTYHISLRIYFFLIF